MTAGGRAPDDAERRRFLALLDQAQRTERAIRFWWRDDDAVTATPALDRLLELAGRHDLPLALAVVPKNATAELAAAAEASRVSMLQHGWQHRNHAPEGEKKSELGDARPLAEILDELRQGFDRLQALTPSTFVPILVPPWNRIAASVAAARREVGLAGLSAFGRAPRDEAHWVNVHVDILGWHPTRPLERAAVYGQLSREIARRLDGDDEPIGIMTHHLLHAEESWALLEELFAILAAHPAVTWPKTRAVFALA